MLQANKQYCNGIEFQIEQYSLVIFGL